MILRRVANPMPRSFLWGGASALPPSFRSASSSANESRFCAEFVIWSSFRNAGRKAGGSAEALAPQKLRGIRLPIGLAAGATP
jgi:hypothetical protein